MSAIPCPIRLDECPGADSPITNASSEAPDPFFFVGIGYNPYDPYNPITIDQGPKPDCDVIDWSLVDQTDANLMAIISAANCRPPPGPRPRPDPSCTADPNQPPCINDDPFPRPPDSNIHRGNLQQFTNDAQSVSISCPNGTVFTLSVAAGTFLSPFMDPAAGPAWVAYINAWIHAYLLSQLVDEEVCIDIPGLTERFPPQDEPPGWPPGCAWPPTDPTCWPPFIWPPTPPDWPLDCAWPPMDATCFPPGYDWKDPINWPHQPNNPTTPISAWPGWICLGSELEPTTNSYVVLGTGDWEFEISGGMEPPGTSLVKTSSNTAVLQGTPSAPGFYAWSVRATNGIKSVEVADAMNVLGLITSSPGAAEAGTPYSASLQAAGGTGPYSFVAVGTLPPGLSLASDGTISGTPTTTGVYAFDVRITDAGGRSCLQPVSIEVLPSAGCPDWSQLLWGVPSITAIMAGTGSFTPDSVMSPSFHAHCDSPDAVFGHDQVTVISTATLIYNGPGCNCNLHTILTLFSTNNLLSVLSAGVSIDQNGTFLIFNAPLPAWPPMPPVDVDTPFTVLDTFGIPQTITVTVFIQSPNTNLVMVNDHESIDLQGTITNI